MVSRFSRVPLLPVLPYMTNASVTETEVNYSLTSLVGNPLRPSNIIKINNNPGVLNEHNQGLIQIPFVPPRLSNWVDGMDTVLIKPIIKKL